MRTVKTWRAFEDAPKDGSSILAWHKIWECAITIKFNSVFGKDLPWMEGTGTCRWPTESFTHWRQCLEGPKEQGK